MKKRIGDLTMIYLLLIILLFVSGLMKGFLSTAFYLLSFLLPLGVGLYILRKESRTRLDYLTIDREGVGKTLPLIAPTLSVIMLISFITSFLIYRFTGRVNNVDVGDSLILALISQAVLPAVLEEALFRYLPLRMLAPHSRRGAVLVSAFFFALVHQDLFTIPYAFIAGVIFMAIDIATDSVIPSVIIHFINNAVSVFLLIYSDIPEFSYVLYSILEILTVISVSVIIYKKEIFREMLSDAFEEGDKCGLTRDMLCFGCLMLVSAVAKLFLGA